MKKIYLPVIAAAMLAAAGCQRQPAGEPGEGEEATVTFSVTLPPQASVNSRAYSDTDVENIDVLIFDQDSKFIERVSIDDISGSGSVKSFSMRLNFTPQARTFHIVANGRAAGGTDRVNFADVTPGMTESTAIPLLRTTAATVTEATITPLVMWGRATIASIDAPVINIAGTKLLRSQAAIMLRMGEGVDNFFISSTLLHSVPDFGRVAPGAYTSSSGIPVAPTVPAGVTMVNYYESNYSPGGNTAVVYLYERENTAQDHLSIIIHGIYGGMLGYYRAVLTDGNEAFMNIVRNHRYTVTIVKAEGYGYSSIQEALDNPPSNLRVEITDELDDISFIVADGKNELGVSVNYVELRGTPVDAQVELATLYSSRSQAPSVVINHQAFNSGALSLQPNGTYKLFGTWNQDIVAEGNIAVSAVALSQTITLVTKPISGYISETPDSYVYKLFDGASQPWSVRIVANNARARLSASPEAVNFSGDPEWGLSSMESRMYSTAYLHLLKTGAVAAVQFSCIDDTNSLRVGRIIYSQ